MFAPHRGQVFGMSGFFLALAILLSPFIWDGASARAEGGESLQMTSSLAPDMFDGSKFDVVAALEPVSTDVWSKIEAIRRMGGRNLSRLLPRLDVMAASAVGKLAESTENPVRNVTKCGPCQPLVKEGLGRAPPRFDL